MRADTEQQLSATGYMFDRVRGLRTNVLAWVLGIGVASAITNNSSEVHMLNYKATIEQDQVMNRIEFSQFASGLIPRLNVWVRIEDVGEEHTHVTLYMPRKNVLLDILVIAPIEQVRAILPTIYEA